MEVIALQSGSNGNCAYVEAGGRRLLFDAGISGRQAQMRLAQVGRDITDVDALLISHDHVDHSRSMGIYQRKFTLPVYVTAATFRAAGRYAPGAMDDVRHFQAGDTLRFGAVTVETIPTPHVASTAWHLSSMTAAIASASSPTWATSLNPWRRWSPR